MRLRLEGADVEGVPEVDAEEERVAAEFDQLQAAPLLVQARTPGLLVELKLTVE